MATSAKETRLQKEHAGEVFINFCGGRNPLPIMGAVNFRKSVLDMLKNQICLKNFY